MPGGRKWLQRLAMSLALGSAAGGVAISASNPVNNGWTADPEEQFLLDVNIRQLRLGDGVRAYNTPEGSCIVFGDFLTTLDVPMRVDLTARKASGWAFTEANRISIDLASGTATYRGKSEPIATGSVRETPEGWCVETNVLARWFGIGVKPLTAGSALLLESEAKLPVELAVERERRAKNLQLRPAQFDISTLPQVRLPYRMWRAPALDFVVSGGVTYRARDGVKVDRQSSVYAAGEIARLSYDAQVTTNSKGVPNNLRLRAYRSDPESRLLGPLKATHFGLGDVSGFDSRLSGSPENGRGALVTNRPLLAQTTFDRTRFEGDLPSGWEAEIYRNGELLAFAKPTGDQRYLFDDVQLFYGENRVRIILYGPQGQIRTREELINVGQDNVPAGKTWYWAGANQPGRDLVSLEPPPDNDVRPIAQAAAAVEHGLDERTSVGALARMMLVEDERLSFIEGTVRRSIGSAMIEVAAAGDSSGGKAARAQLVAKIGSVNVAAEALAANDFHLRGRSAESVRDVRMALDAPIRLAKAIIPAHADVHYTDRLDGTKQLEAAGRLAANIDRFNLAGDLRYRKQYLRSDPSPPGEMSLGLMGAGRLGNVRLRGATSFDIAPERRLRSVEMSAYWSATEKTDWEAGVVYDAPGKRGRARVTHVRRLDTMAIAVTGEAASDGAMALGLNLNFSLDPGRFRMSRRPLAAAGAVHARVYRDLNDNGVRDAAEPIEKGAYITAGRKVSDHGTDARGSVLIGGLSTFTPVTVGIDQTSLSDPMLIPRKALQVVVPRPGIAAEVEIGLVAGGDVEGAIVKSGGIGFEGLDLELVDASGKAVATARTDLDGFFLFERLPYGEYRLQVSRDSASATGLNKDIGIAVSVNDTKAIVRLGSIHIDPPPRIAASQ